MNLTLRKHYLHRVGLVLLLASQWRGAQATTRTVNNATVPINPGQYATIGAAIGASANGDTVLVTGSLAHYNEPSGSLTVDRRIVLLGAGFNPKSANDPTILDLQMLLNDSASGSLISGFQFNNTVQSITGGGTAHKNIVFSRNLFYGGVYFNADSSINIKFINNIHNVSVSYGVLQFNSPEMAYQCGVYNSIFIIPDDGILTNYSNPACPAIEIDHNLFIYSTQTYYNGSCYTRNAKITNNIFYNTMPIEWTWYYYYYDYYMSLGIINNQFYNNISYSPGFTQRPFVSNGEYGSNNIENTDPKLISVFNNPSAAVDFNLDNLRPAPGSPCINAGNDSTDIGPAGGRYPIYNINSRFLTGEPDLPKVKQISAAGRTTIAPGGQYKVTVKSQINN